MPTELELKQWAEKPLPELTQMLAEVKAQIRTAREVREEAEARHQALETKGSELQKIIARKELALQGAIK